MQTRFSPAQLTDPDTASSNAVLRACVHCGFCTATCPTYVLLGDELDSPRGRIYLIRDMLEQDQPPTPAVVKHIDRCLSCLACMTTCPSGVNYMHLIDHARQHIARTYRRPWPDRAVRAVLGAILPRPWAFRAALRAARIARPLAALVPPRLCAMPRLRAMLRLAPARLPPPGPTARPAVFAAPAPPRHRVALLTGCAQPVLAPQINEATIRLLNRHGCDVVVAPGAGCCGALTHHLGRNADATASANLRAWSDAKVDAVLINTSGCGTMVKEYGHLLRGDPVLAEPARRIAAITWDITEFIARIGLASVAQDFAGAGMRVAYHAACSLQHGQQVRTPPKALLAACGFVVLDVPQGHLCCGSAGTYNLLQPRIADALQSRKVAAIESTAPDLVASGNLGCLTQIGIATQLPVIHTVELLDWATGGPRPAGLTEKKPPHSASC